MFVRFPVLPGTRLGDGPLAGASVVIWTTTPWTMPGNRALAYGPEIEYALVSVDGVAEGSLARVGERLLVALALLPQVCAATGIAAHHVVHVYQGTELAGLVCAHPLRGQGYDHDAPLLPADYVTTDQGTGFVHIAPSHGEEDFLLGRQYGIEVPEAVGPDGSYADWVPLFAGQHVFKAAAPVGAALEAAGGLLGRGTLTHSYPHSWRSKAPVIYRATPQWFIRMDGPERLRERALEAIGQTAVHPRGRAHPAGQHGGGPAGLVHQPAARLGRADPGVRGPPHRRAAARPGGGGADRGRLHAGGRGRLVQQPGQPLPGWGLRRRRVRAGHGHRGCLVRERQHARLRVAGPRAALAGGPVPGGQRPAPRLVPVVPAGGGGDPRAGAVQGGADAWLRAGRGRAEDEQVAGQRHGAGGGDGADGRGHPAPVGRERRHHGGPADRAGDPEAAGGAVPPPAEHAAVAAGEPGRVPRRGAGGGGGPAGVGAVGAAPAVRAGWAHPRGAAVARLDRGVSGPACVLLGGPVGVLLRRAEGRAVLRRAGQRAAPGGADGAGPPAPLPGGVAGAGAVLHGGGGVAGPVPVRGRQRSPASLPGPARGMARPGAGRALGGDPRRAQRRDDGAGGCAGGEADRVVAASSHHGAAGPDGDAGCGGLGGGRHRVGGRAGRRAPGRAGAGGQVRAVLAGAAGGRVAARSIPRCACAAPGRWAAWCARPRRNDHPPTSLRAALAAWQSMGCKDRAGSPWLPRCCAPRNDGCRRHRACSG